MFFCYIPIYIYLFKKKSHTYTHVHIGDYIYNTIDKKKIYIHTFIARVHIVTSVTAVSSRVSAKFSRSLTGAR